MALPILIVLVTGCAAPTPTPAPSPEPEPTLDRFFSSDGSGEPRGTAYWQLWNTCPPKNKAETARANGGREKGWILVDDLLADPGIRLGGLQVTDCEQALNLTQGLNIAGEKAENDPAYPLAAELLAAQFNLEVGAESCLAVVQAVLGAQALLKEHGFDGQKAVLGPGSPAGQLSEAQVLLESLRQYNRGELCR